MVQSPLQSPPPSSSPLQSPSIDIVTIPCTIEDRKISECNESLTNNLEVVVEEGMIEEGEVQVEVEKEIEITMEDGEVSDDIVVTKISNGHSINKYDTSKQHTNSYENNHINKMIV